MKVLAGAVLLFFVSAAAAQAAGVEVDKVDLPVAGNLRFLGHDGVNPAHVMDVEIAGDRAYIASGLGVGLETYDISDPWHPVRIATHGVATWNTKAHGDRLFAFTRDDGFQIYDIAGSTPVYLGGYNPAPWDTLFENGTLSGNTLYVTAHHKGVFAFDVSNPASPNPLGSLLLADNACWDAAVLGSHLLVANGPFGLSVVELGGAPTEVAVLPLPGLANHILLDGSVAVLSLSAGGIATVDVSNPAAPVLLDRIPSAGNATGFGIWNHRAAVGSWAVLEAFDISDPAAIESAGFDNTRTWAMGADVADWNGKGLVVVGDWRGVSTYFLEPDSGPNIDVVPQYLDFGEVATAATRRVIVRNTGAAPLHVNLSSIPAGFTAQPQVFSVAPGAERGVRVTASGTATVAESLLYNSNDPDEASVKQFVYKNSVTFPQVGSEPPQFVLKDIDGYWHYLSDTKGQVVFLEFGGLW